MTIPHLALAPLLTLFVGVFATYGVGTLTGGDDSRILGWIASGFLALSLGLSLALGTLELPYAYSFLGEGTALEITSLGILLAVVATGVGLVTTVYSIRDMHDSSGQQTYYPLVLSLVAGVVGIGFAATMFSLYVFFELMAISTYALVPFRIDRREAIEAGYKYLVMNVVGSVLAIFGIAIVYAAADGTLSFTALQSGLQVSGDGLVSPLAAAVLLILVGFGVKSAIVPLHTWVPDAYAEAPSGISAILAGVATPSAIIALVKCLAVFPSVIPIGALLLVFGAVTMTAGNVLAFQQDDLKRLLAYSSIPHVGYVVVGLGVGFYGGYTIAFDGAFFHILANAVMKGGAFLGAGAILYRLREADRPDARSIDAIRGVAYEMPIATGAIVIAVLALAGVPPLAGFWGKLFIVIGSAQLAGALGVALALLVVANSFLSLGYYVPLLGHMFASEHDGQVEGLGSSPTLLAVPLVVLTALVLVLGIAPMVGLELVHPAAELVASATGVTP